MWWQYNCTMWWCTQKCVYMCTTFHVYPHVQHIKPISKGVYLYQAINVSSYIHVQYFMMSFCRYSFALYTYKEGYITWYCTPCEVYMCTWSELRKQQWLHKSNKRLKLLQVYTRNCRCVQIFVQKITRKSVLLYIAQFIIIFVIFCKQSEVTRTNCENN